MINTQSIYKTPPWMTSSLNKGDMENGFTFSIQDIAYLNGQEILSLAKASPFVILSWTQYTALKKMILYKFHLCPFDLICNKCFHSYFSCPSSKNLRQHTQPWNPGPLWLLTMAYCHCASNFNIRIPYQNSTVP